jgi:hypothetical protein
MEMAKEMLLEIPERTVDEIAAADSRYHLKYNHKYRRNNHPESCRKDKKAAYSYINLSIC